MKPATLGLEEVRPHDMLALDLAGKKLAGTLPRHMEFPIHTEVYRQRPEVQCVIHTHPPYATAFSAVADTVTPAESRGGRFRARPATVHANERSDRDPNPRPGCSCSARNVPGAAPEKSRHRRRRHVGRRSLRQRYPARKSGAYA